MNGVYPLAWVFLGFVIITLIMLNVFLIKLYRNKGKISRTNNMVKKIGESIRHPLQKEAREYLELNQRVKELKNPEKPTDSIPDDPCRNQSP